MEQAPDRRKVLYRKLGIPVVWLQGTVLAERRRFRMWSADLAAARRVRLVPNRVGGMYLAVEDRQGRQAGCHVLVIGLTSARHLSPDVLDQISSALAQSGEPSALAASERLREQSRYLRTRQGLGGSPLRTHSEWVPGGLGIPAQEVPLPHSRDAYGTVPRDDPRAPDDGVR